MRGGAPAYHPAGFDDELRYALEELRTGRWMAMRDLLASTGRDEWALWTSRTQVLGIVAAGSTVVDTWRTEEPRSVDAVVMRARVTVERAMRAHREGHSRARDLSRGAWEACHYAAHNAPADPVPWVCLLTLAQLDGRQERPEHRALPAEPMLFPGPWGLLQEVYSRDPFNREAYHRMLQFVYARQTGKPLAEAGNFARWVVSWAPEGSPLVVLPLYVHAERYRVEQGYAKALDLHWITDAAVSDAERALYGWFRASEPAGRSLLDLNYLAHALWAAQRFAEAGPVFRALGPFATVQPWSFHTADPGSRKLADREFIAARDRCLALGDTRDGQE